MGRVSKKPKLKLHFNNHWTGSKKLCIDFNDHNKEVWDWINKAEKNGVKLTSIHGASGKNRYAIIIDKEEDEMLEKIHEDWRLNH